MQHRLPSTAGSVCTISVTFNPYYVGPVTGQVVVVTSAGTFQYGMTGVGVAPLGVLSPGTISTVAGTGVAGSTGNGSAATAATLSAPRSVAFDSTGSGNSPMFSTMRCAKSLPPAPSASTRAADPPIT